MEDKKRAETTDRILNALDDPRVQESLRKSGFDPDTAPEDLKKNLEAAPSDEIDSVYLDYMRIVAEDHRTDVRQLIERNANRYWQVVVDEIEEHGAHIRETLIPQALDQLKRGNVESYRAIASEIDAESVALVSAAHQGRLGVREQLRRDAFEEAPYMPRTDRFAIVNEVASAEDLSNTALVAPAAVQETTAAVASFRHEVARRERQKDEALLVELANRQGTSPRPK